MLSAKISDIQYYKHRTGLSRFGASCSVTNGHHHENDGVIFIIMKRFLYSLIFLLVAQQCIAQEILPVPFTTPSATNAEEKVIGDGADKMIVGVENPTISVYLPDPAINTGSAVILCPGGGMRVLSWGNDVERMAKYLNARGIAAIGLKYRLNNSEMPKGLKMDPMVDVTGFQKFVKANANPVSYPAGDLANSNAIDDARNAIKLVRQHAEGWGIDPAKIGFLGFSAGGGVAVGATVKAEQGEMPDFLITVYGPSLIDVDVPENAPDLLVLSRADHPNVAAGCLDLFLEWKKAGKNAEMHLYGDGKGPFTLADRVGQNTTDTWSDNLMAWLVARGFARQTAD